MLGCILRSATILSYLLGPKLMLEERDKHYPSRSGQVSLTTAETNITKPVTNNNFGPSTEIDFIMPPG